MNTIQTETAAPYLVPSHDDGRAIIDRALSYIESQARSDDDPQIFESAGAAAEYFRLRLRLRDREIFACAFLDSRHRLIDCEELFAGTIDAATVHPRVIVRRALIVNAAAIVISHNHPSGCAEPSAADVTITRKIVDACRRVDVRVLDHIVVGDPCVSMAERGLI